uniref:Cilia- and flagella-associated protein 45 n=1 Tax=Anolis carolinensis TaxID=28377 RepID=H9G785_ANOCA
KYLNRKSTPMINRKYWKGLVGVDLAFWSCSSPTSSAVLSFLQEVQLSRSGSPIVVLREVEKAGKSLGWGHKPKTIRIIGRDLIRDLVVPTVDPSGESLIISPKDFERIKDASHVLTKEERAAQEATLKAEREAILAAVNERKKSMQLKEILRKKNEKLNDLEEEAKERAQYLLERAANLRMEQEEEIKALSEIVLEAKCHAIRDAQILEKKQIEKEMSEEQMRLARMMEVERQKANKMQDELEQKRKEELYRGRRYMMEQIEKNNELHAIRSEQRDQEAQEMLDYLERLQFEDERVSQRNGQDLDEEKTPSSGYSCICRLQH